jgi:hypothetical protein
LWINIIKKNSYFCNYIPQNIYDEDFCNQLIEINSNNIKCFPEKYKTKENYIKALNNNKYVFLENVPENIKNEIENFYEKYCRVISDIPANILTKELCKIIIKRNHIDDRYTCVDNVPFDYWDDDFITFALECNIPMDSIPKEKLKPYLKKLTRDDLLKYSRYYPNIYWIPKEVINHEMYRDIFKLYPQQLHDYVTDYAWKAYLNLEVVNDLPKDVYLGLLKFKEIPEIPKSMFNEEGIEEIMNANPDMIGFFLYNYYNDFKIDFIKKLCSNVKSKLEKGTLNYLVDMYPEYFD